MRPRGIRNFHAIGPHRGGESHIHSKMPSDLETSPKLTRYISVDRLAQRIPWEKINCHSDDNKQENDTRQPTEKNWGMKPSCIHALLQD